jgi:cobalt-zinc-cadmium efflux system membrane fusion protein
MVMNRTQLLGMAGLLGLGLVLALLILFTKPTGSEEGEESHQPGTEHAGETTFPTGPQGGRLLEQPPFALEITLYETGVPPEFRVYPTYRGEPVVLEDVDLTLRLYRLGERVDTIRFRPSGPFLRGDREVEEPHSFTVAVEARYQGQPYTWQYDTFEGRVEMADETMQSTGIALETAGPALIRDYITLPGEVALNTDRVARVVPRVAGIVAEVRRNLGDRVRRGETLCVVESRELAEARSNYLTALAREELTRTTFTREQRLFEQKISAEQDYLAARQALTEAEITRKATGQQLRALGVLLPTAADEAANLTRYEVRAPFDGILVEKNISLGEAVSAEKEVFIVADLSSVWVEITVYPRDLSRVQVGQRALVQVPSTSLQAVGTLAYVGPLVGDATRTAKARLILPNTDGNWRPGLFVEVQVLESEAEVPLAVRAEALQTWRDGPAVFARYGDQFEVRPLVLGQRDSAYAEVRAGLLPGTRYATANSFVLKAELGKAGATHDH